MLQRAAQPALVEFNDFLEQPATEAIPLPRPSFASSARIPQLPRSMLQRCRSAAIRRSALPPGRDGSGTLRDWWTKSAPAPAKSAARRSWRWPARGKTFRSRPVIEINGRNTTIGVSVEPINGTVNSRSALFTASRRPSPPSRCSTMFSTTTMASSITSPPAAARPPSVIILKLWPRIFMAMNVTKIATGITSPVISAVPKSRRNSQMMNPASKSPMMIASRTLAMDSRTMLDWS